MAWWNSANCWPNYMFNFVNRHGDAGWSLKTPLLYAVTLIYVLGPPVLWLALKNRRSASADSSARALPGALGTLAWLPFLLFALLSGVKQIGLHWLLSFVPFTLIWLTLRLPPATLQKLGLFFAGFATLHIAAILWSRACRWKPGRRRGSTTASCWLSSIRPLRANSKPTRRTGCWRWTAIPMP
jgi:hypothetical protein